MPPSTSPASFTIPTIDISSYLSDPDSASAFHIISAVRSACTHTGFFQLTGHGISPDLQSAVFAGSAEFFRIPLEEKLKLDRTHAVDASNRGYELIGGQALQEGTKPDLKEGFYIGQHIPATDPRVEKKAFLIGPNIWPPSSLVPETIFKDPMTEYFEAIFALSLKVLALIAAGLPYGPDVFEEFTSNDPISSIRLLHYPPDEEKDEKRLGAGAHTDFGAVTLLLQDGMGGLQVFVKDEEEGEEGKWVDVPPVEGAYVVNVGDMLQMWTSGEYKSSLHRVVNRSGGDRYIVPFSFDGNCETVLAPLDGSGEGKQWPSVEEHMRERFGSTYGKGKKREDGKVNFVS